MALRLYDHPLSPYSQKIKIALREKGVPEARLPTGLGSGEQNDGLGAANPRGEVPALVLETGRPSLSPQSFCSSRSAGPSRPWRPPALGRARARSDRGGHGYALRGHQLGPGGNSSLWAQRWRPPHPASAGAEADLKQWHAWLEAQLGNAPWLAGIVSAGPMLSYAPPLGSEAFAPGRQKVGWAFIWRGPRRGPAFRRGGRKLQPRGRRR